MNNEKLELVRAWITKAFHDLKSAYKLASGSDPIIDTALYHCQQTVEKVLKGFLVFHDIRFKKIHDIGKLVELC